MRKLKKVLLVDDDPVNNYVNEELLKELDIIENIHVETNGKDALAYLLTNCEDSCEDSRKVCPPLVIFDHIMPVMDGLDFIKALNAIDFMNRKQVVFILLGVDSRLADIEEYKKLGVHEFTQKPLSKEVVLHAYHTYFSTDMAL
jgi:CheY-like chemotaxis protein